MPIKTPTTQLAVINFYDGSATLFNPATVTCTVTSPAGVSTLYTYGLDYQLKNPDTGVFTLEWLGSAGETWTVKWYGASSDGHGGLTEITDESPVTLLDTFT
jgi:hypothetical protein